MKWKAIKGYEGYYEVSDAGIVRSVPRMITRIDGRTYTAPSVILSTFQGNTCNYLSIQLSRDNKPQKFMVHRLVAQAFLGLDLDSCYEVNHKDGNRHNNRLENLEVVTHQQNIDHSVHTGLKQDYGEQSTNAKLTNAQAEEIRRAWSRGVAQKDLAETYQVCKQTISNIVHNKRYVR